MPTATGVEAPIQDAGTAPVCRKRELPGFRRPADSAAFLLGAGTMGILDTVLFHQILQWHHFYTHTTPRRQIASDGLLQVMTGSLMLSGALTLWHNREQVAPADHDSFTASFIIGMGSFQLYDGIINHKVLRLHQVRENAKNQLPYDVAWNGAALALIGAGYLLWRRGRGTDVGL